MSGILLVDIGNTSTCVAVWRGGRAVRMRRCPTRLSHPAATAATVRSAVGAGDVSGAALCSVVPRATAAWVRAVKKVCGVRTLVVNHKLELGVRIDYPCPQTIGADRLANAAGVAWRYGVPAIVADFGTALTFDIVSAGNAYIGGVIAPGLPMMADYLAERTALLPHIRIRGAIGRIGRSTAGAMRIGARVGYRGMVREIAEYLRSSMRGDVILCATGGFARWVLAGFDLPFILDPNLTLIGLYRIYTLNEREKTAGCAGGRRFGGK